MLMTIPELPQLSFRPITRNDFETIHQWSQRPHVAEWWESPSSIAEMEALYESPTIGASSTRAYLAQRDGELIGFIQVYLVMGSDDGWWQEEKDPGARGVDLFLAHPDQIDKGLGTAMVRSFVSMLFGNPAVTTVQADPHPNNHRAIRCYAKAGFDTIGPVVTPDGKALLMRCTRQSFSRNPREP
jgi:RimJ/RimL family protein N-acetyltransferase